VRLLSFALVLVLLVGCSGSLEQTLTPAHTAVLTESASTNTGAEVSISTDRVYYQITGISADVLRAQIDQFGHTDETGRHWDAYTEWYVTWSYPYSITDGNCATGPVEVVVEITFVFPQWDISADAPPELVDKWNDYIIALELHEEGHKEIAIEAGHEVWQVLNGLTSYSSCDELEQTADVATEEILEHYRQREVVYDQETEHGATQGARFP